MPTDTQTVLFCSDPQPPTAWHMPIHTELVDPDSQRPFIRVSCRDCEVWLGDRLPRKLAA